VEVPVSEYVASDGTFPDRIHYENANFRLDDSGTTRREGRTIRYHTYKEMWESGSRSITIEGEPSDELDAVLTESISPGDIAAGTGGGDAESGWEVEVEMEDDFEDEF
jgi:hypothetical protein